MQDFLVSIITVCLNAEETIETTIRSILQQTYKKIEYIVIDGGSTDGTLQILEKYREHISTLVSEKDEGLYDAMNKGIKLARGDYIGIINADDWYEKDAVEHVVHICQTEQEDYGVISGQIRLIEGGKTFLSGKKDIKRIWTEMPIAHPATFIKKNVYSRYGKYDTRYKIAADYELIFRLFVNDIKFYISDKILANYRIGGISGVRKDILFEEDVEILRRYQKFCDEPNRVNESVLRKKGMHIVYHADQEFFRKTLDIGLDMKDTVYIFGCGYWGRELCRLLENQGIRIEGFVDNNSSLWGMEVENHMVEAPDILKNQQLRVVIAIQGDTLNIESQIRTLSREASTVNLEYILGKAAELMKG